MVKYYIGGEKPETGKKYRAFGGNALDISGIVQREEDSEY